MRKRVRFFSHKAAGAVVAFDTRFIAGVSDNTTVTTWADLSGNGRDASQGLAWARPVYKVAIQGGNPILRFGGGHWYQGNHVAGTEYSTYCVYGGATTGTRFVFSSGVPGGTADSQRRFQLVYYAGSFSDESNGGGASVLITQNSNFNIHSVSAQIGTGAKVYLLNGGSQASADASALAGVPAGTLIYRIGLETWNTLQYFVGDMSFLSNYNTAHAAPMRRRLEQFMAYSFKIACS